MKKEQQAKSVDSHMGSEGFSQLGEVNGDITGIQSQAEKEMKSSEDDSVSNPSHNNAKSIVNKLSPPSLMATADRNPGDAHSVKVRDDNDVQASQLKGHDIDDSTVSHVQSTQSMPVWIPSVVATTINENDEERAFEKIGDISLDKLRNDVDKAYSPPDHQFEKTKSLTSISTPDPVHRLPNTNNKNRRERQNAEHANLRNAADKFSERKKKRLLKKITRIQEDGTLGLDFEEDRDLAASLFESEAQETAGDEDMENEETGSVDRIPPLRIVILVVGTRGDVQPFIAIGKKMQEYGHQVRLSTHANFKDLVKSSGIEFYPLGGDSKVLAEYMVKNKGFLSTGPMEVQKQRKQIKLIVNSLLAPCTKPAEDSDIPFNAQVIIANPPVYGHVHVAEYLKVPLRIMFTMPWTPTSAFPHPLSRISKPAAYKLSYQVVDATIWLGIRSIINDFRKKKLKLHKIPYFSNHGSLTKIPTSYLWSPHLVPKPDDWGPLIDVVGFCSLEQASKYEPPEDLVKFLKAGPAPIYVGFGSLPIEDPLGMTKIIIEALRQTKQRAIISEGSDGLGRQDERLDFTYLLQDCPHDWLFPQCVAVVHHGGAGTTAASIKAACPTTVVPFFGDQPFWGSRIHDRGVGPEPIPICQFSVQKLVDAINFMLNPEVKEKAEELAKMVAGEDGAQGALDAFHKHIRVRIPEIMEEKPPMSQSQRTNGQKLGSFCTACWTCNRSHSQI